MKPILILVFLSIILNGLVPGEETLSFGRFGPVTLYQDSIQPRRMVLFISGDGGWNLGVVDMARAIAGEDALVAGIDITRYLKQLEKSTESCSYPAADFESLSKFIQKEKKFSDYQAPILIGYSSGATLAYALIVQAPPNTFAGAISLGFCPDLPLTKPLCRGGGLEWGPGPKGKGYSFLPTKNLPVPWIAFQGTVDQVCSAESTAAYVRQVKNGEIVMLEKVGHGFSVQKNWLPQFRDAFRKITARSQPVSSPIMAEIGELPLIEVRPERWQADCFAVIITGDGGWASIDRSLGNTLAARGVGVIGLNSLKYFWKARTPASSARDLERIVRHYLAAWKKEKAILIGYSLGADVLPFMANRLPADIQNRISLIALIGPSRRTEFEFHLSEWLGMSSGKNSLPVLPEVEKLRGKKILCFCGSKESDSLCLLLDSSLAKTICMPGGHHLGGDYESLATSIIDEAR